MGRKSGAKSQTRTPSDISGPPPSGRGRSYVPLIASAVVAALAIGGLVTYSRSGQPEPTGQVAQATPAVIDPPLSAKLGPHPQDNLPPLPFQAYAPPTRSRPSIPRSSATCRASAAANGPATAGTTTAS